MSAEQTLVALAREQEARIAVAESCTGGMIGAAITSVPGSSDVFDRGFVTYSNTAKIDMLGVADATLKQFGAVSEEVARQMADGAMVRSGASHVLSVTGIAGPGGSESKPEGRVCFALALTQLETETQTIEFGAIGRDAVRAAASAHAIDMLTKALQ